MKKDIQREFCANCGRRKHGEYKLEYIDLAKL